MRTRTITLLTLLLGVGCATARDIEGSDHDSLFPTGRAWFDLLQDRGEDARGQLGIEVSGTGGKGSFDIDLRAGETIATDDGSISGPTTVATDFTMYEAAVALRGGTKRRFNIQGIVGIGYSRVDLELLAAGGGRGSQISTSVDEFGPLLGGQVGFRATDWWEFYLRGTVLLLNMDTGFVDLTTSTQIEVGSRFSLGDNVGVIAGYRWWRYQQEDYTFTTDVDIRASGFVVGVVVRF